MDRMVVNAAIERLIAGNDSNADAARVVIAAYAQLSRQSFISIEVSGKGGKSDSFTGHTNHGDVTIKDKKTEEKKEWSVGILKERVGYYKVWKRRKGQLCIQYFWKSDLTTQSVDKNMTPPCYYLGYDGLALDPLYFGIERAVPLLRFHFLGSEIMFYRAEVVLIHGELENKKLYYGLSSIAE